MSDETRSEEERAKFKSQLAEFADAGWRAHYEQTAKAAAADLIRRREAIMATMLTGFARMYGPSDIPDEDDRKTVQRARMLADAIMEAAR